MKELKENSSWSLDELSDTYHLIRWQHTRQEVIEIIGRLHPIRTPSAIGKQFANILLYLAKDVGNEKAIKRWKVAPYTDAKYQEAVNSGVSARILPYKKSKFGIHKPEIANKEPKTVAHQEPTIIPEPVVPKKAAPTKTPVEVPASKEPDILDMMTRAKELGASGIEYTSLKIKY